MKLNLKVNLKLNSKVNLKFKFKSEPSFTKQLLLGRLLVTCIVVFGGVLCGTRCAMAWFVEMGEVEMGEFEMGEVEMGEFEMGEFEMGEVERYHQKKTLFL